jgi:hypothetical protein
LERPECDGCTVYAIPAACDDITCPVVAMQVYIADNTPPRLTDEQRKRGLLPMFRAGLYSSKLHQCDSDARDRR